MTIAHVSKLSSQVGGICHFTMRSQEIEALNGGEMTQDENTADR